VVEAVASALQFLSDPQVLQGLAAFVGPMAFFAAPTEEIESMLNQQTDFVDHMPSACDPITHIETPAAKAA
jgi:hypothetical protein